MDIRQLTGQREFNEASRLEVEIWGNPDPIPASLLTVFAHHGGVVLGAYSEHRMVGVSVGFPGLDAEGELYLHSHLLAVAPSYRSQHLGAALKAQQWEVAQTRGFSYIGWTFDPLMAANAWFNLAVLGARVVSIQENVYGLLDDALNGSMPTHRLWVRWEGSSPLRTQLATEEVMIPIDVAALRHTDPERARGQLNEYFSDMMHRWDEGWRIVGVRREAMQVFYRWAKESREMQ